MGVQFYIQGVRVDFDAPDASDWYVDLNMRNAHDLLAAIGLPCSPDMSDAYGDMAAPVLATFIKAAIASDAFGGTALPQREGRMGDFRGAEGPMGQLALAFGSKARVIVGARSEGHLEMRARQLLALCERAGSRRITWG